MRIGEAKHRSYSPFQHPALTASQREATGQAKAPQDRLTSAAAPMQDTVTLTIDEKQRLKKAARQKQLEEAQQELKEYQRMLEASKEQAEAAGDAAKIRLKCMIIASRIMSGDKVPPEDYRYLAKNDPGLYGKALTMRFERDKPKRHDRLSEEEEEEGTVYSGSATEAASSLSAEESGASSPGSASESNSAEA